MIWNNKKYNSYLLYILYLYISEIVPYIFTIVSKYWMRRKVHTFIDLHHLLDLHNLLVLHPLHNLLHDDVGDALPVELPQVPAHPLTVGAVIRIISLDWVHVDVPPLLIRPACEPPVELRSSSVLLLDLDDGLHPPVLVTGRYFLAVAVRLGASSLDLSAPDSKLGYDVWYL